jgi:hypothetical protein
VAGGGGRDGNELVGKRNDRGEMRNDGGGRVNDGGGTGMSKEGRG